MSLPSSKLSRASPPPSESEPNPYLGFQGLIWPLSLSSSIPQARFPPDIPTVLPHQPPLWFWHARLASASDHSLCPSPFLAHSPLSSCPYVILVSRVTASEKLLERDPQWHLWLLSPAWLRVSLWSCISVTHVCAHSLTLLTGLPAPWG